MTSFSKLEFSSVAVSLTLSLLILGRCLHQQPRCRVVSGPSVFGILPTIIKAMARYDVMELLARLHEKEGNTYYLHFGVLSYFVTPLVVTRDPRNVEYMLKQNFPNFPKGPEFHSILLELLGDGIFNVDGTKWTQQRKTSSQMFTAKRFKNHIWKVVQKNCGKMVDLLAAVAADHGTCDLFNLLNRFTLDSIGEIGFGTSVGSLENPESPFLKSFDEAQRCAVRRFWVPGWQIWRLLGLGTEKIAKLHYKALRDYSSEILADLRFNLNSDAGDSFVGLFMKQDPSLSDGFLTDLVLNFLIAGRDTTAQAMSWCLHLVMQHPSVLQRMRTEIQRVCGSRPLEYDQLKELKYVEAVLKESLRLYPSVPVDSKQNLEADTLPDGTRIPRNTFLIYNSYGMGRSQEIWGKDATEFQPDRWSGLEAVSPYSNPVFHAGPRECLGKRLAMVEMKAVITSLLRRFDFWHAVPVDSIRTDSALTIGMSSGLPCHVNLHEG